MTETIAAQNRQYGNLRHIFYAVRAIDTELRDVNNIPEQEELAFTSQRIFRFMSEHPGFSPLTTKTITRYAKRPAADLQRHNLKTIRQENGRWYWALLKETA